MDDNPFVLLLSNETQGLDPTHFPMNLSVWQETLRFYMATDCANSAKQAQ